MFLTKEDQMILMKSRDFEAFFTKTSRIVERALTSEEDINGDFFSQD